MAKTRENGLRTTGKRFEFLPNRWITRDHRPDVGAYMLGLAGVAWEDVRAYLLWLGVDGWKRLNTPGDYRRHFDDGLLERAKLAQARAAAFHRIQSEAPEVAELMRRVRARFGPRAGVGAVVTIGGERAWPVEGVE